LHQLVGLVQESDDKEADYVGERISHVTMRHLQKRCEVAFDHGTTIDLEEVPHVVLVGSHQVGRSALARIDLSTLSLKHL